VDNELNFDTREKNIKFIEAVTLEEVYDLFNQMVFGEPRRINIKLYNHKHFDDTETRNESSEKN
jgi:secreted Zn-dependent insulinase-like peptidase